MSTKSKQKRNKSTSTTTSTTGELRVRYCDVPTAPSEDLSALSAKTVARLSAECDLLLKLLQIEEESSRYLGVGDVDPDVLNRAIRSASQLVELSATLLTGITDDLVSR